MKRRGFLTAVAAVMTLALVSLAGSAGAAEAKLVGAVAKIVMSGNGATVTLKENKTGKNVVVEVTDELTLDKFKDHRIVQGDEVRCKYDVEGGKNVSKLFRKTAGC